MGPCLRRDDRKGREAAGPAPPSPFTAVRPKTGFHFSGICSKYPRQRGYRRGGRVVDRTALEMRHTGNRIGGSNPSLSASWLLYN
jgi:hypothetical protein